MEPPLVAFDFDGTLSGDEMIVELATEAGVGDAVAAITERAMAGELSFAASLRKRVSMLEGLEMDDFERAIDRVQLRPGVKETIQTLREAGIYVAVLTGGFRRGIERRFTEDGVVVDTVVANELIVREGKLAGEVRGPLIEGAKDRALTNCARRIGYHASDCVAVGDGANDIPMLRLAGTAIGFDPEDAVAEYCDHYIESVPGLLPIVGLAE